MRHQTSENLGRNNVFLFCGHPEMRFFLNSEKNLTFLKTKTTAFNRFTTPIIILIYARPFILAGVFSATSIKLYI